MEYLYRVVTRGPGDRINLRLIRCKEADLLAVIARAGAWIESVRRFGDGKVLR